ncbi:MAG: hypothetical protein ACXWRE_11890, partial [Pseudobdellovibrionaceae bacterium]
MHMWYVAVKKYYSPFSAPLVNPRGNTVLAILSATIVIGVFLQTSGFGGILENSSVLSNARVKASRDSIVYRIERYSTLPSTFRNSLNTTNNPYLQNCVLGTGPYPCAGDGTEYPINLYAPTTSNQILAGATNASPVLYDTKGNLCQTGATSANTTCPFEVTASFTAKCPAASASCAVADTIKVHYVVRIPDTLFTNAGIKNRIALNTVDKFADEIQTSAILPPPYGYTPNALYSVTLVSTGPTPAPTPPPPPTYQDALAAITKVVADSTLATTIADRLYNYYGITDLSLLGAFASFWLQNQAAADAAADEMSWEMNNIDNYSPTATDVNNIAAMVALYPSNQVIAVSLAYGLIDNTSEATTVAGMLQNITDVFQGKTIVDVGIWDQKIAEAAAAGIAATGSTSCDANCSLNYEIASVC